MKNNNQKYLIEKNNSRKIETQIDNDNIYVYESCDSYNYRKKNNQKENTNFTVNNRLRKTRTKINNNIKNTSINSVEYFSEIEDSRHQRNMSLNKGINKYSTNIIDNRKSNNRVDLSNIKYKKEYTYNQNINKYNDNKNIKMSGFELYYESDKGERISYNNPYYKNITNKNIDNNKIKINSNNINNNRINNNNLKIEKAQLRKEIKNKYNINTNINKINNSNKIQSISINYNSSNDESNHNTYSSINNTNKRFVKNKINNNNTNSNLTSKVNINQNKKIINFRNFHRPSEIKKIILIQSTYRAHLVQLKLDDYYNIRKYYQEFFELLNSIYINNKWKYFIFKLKKHKKKIKKISTNNKLISTKKKIILKTNEVKMLHKELGDSFNITNDDLKIKLDDIIKENNELKNQIFDNKNIEEKMKQLLEENKKNQSINAIIMKDNRQLAKRLKNIQDNRNNQLVIQNQLPVDLTQTEDTQTQIESKTKLKYLYLKCIFFKKVLKNKNALRIYFNKYKNNIKKLKKKFSIENNNIFINNKKKINIQMAKNLNINFISQNDNYKHFMLYKLIMKKAQKMSNIIPKYFYKYYYKSKIIDNKEKEEIKKRRILRNIIDKKEKYNEFIKRKTLKEWKLRGVIFKMKGVAKELKKKKKLKKKIRDKMAKETLNNLKNKTANFQSAHEFSYKIDKIEKKEDEKEEIKIKEDIQIESDDSL